MNKLETKAVRTPVLDPLILALKSRRVIVALFTILVSLLVLAVPELAHVRNEILTIVLTLALSLIAGLSWEDAATAGRGKAGEPAKSVRDEVLELIAGLFDETGEINTQAARALKKKLP